MDEEIRDLLEKTKTLVEENNKILHSIQRRARAGFIFKLLYWLVILGVAAGTFYYIQPYVKGIMDAYGELKSTKDKLSDLPNSFEEFKDFFGKEEEAPQ